MPDTTRSTDLRDRKRSRPMPGGNEARQALLASMPVTERRLHLAGVATAVLEGGSGAPVVLLHGPAGFAAHWMRVIPALVTTHRVVAPDLPGHGASTIETGSLDADQVLSWLDELIEQTCPSSPVLVGHATGGAIAARLASRQNDRVSQLVLIDTLGLEAFQPTLEFGAALNAFLARPTEQTHERLWRKCAFDLDRVRRSMGRFWDPFAAYNLDHVLTPSVQRALRALIDEFGRPIAPAELERIGVPTTLIWGRHDLATPLAVAEAAGVRYGWSLHIIENAADDPPIEQPEALLHILRAVLGRTAAAAKRNTQ